MEIDPKDFSLESVAAKLAMERGDKSVVLTGGTFDLLHGGHVRYINEIKKRGTILVIGINSDERVRKDKGLRRPIIEEQDRAFILQNLKGVDYVFIKREPFTDSAIRLLRPETVILAGDPGEAESLKQLGTKYQQLFPGLKTVFMDRLGKGTSTTNIEAEIVKRAKLYE